MEDGEIIARGTNDADGNIVFDLIEYSEAGKHTYTIAEEETELGGWTSDSNSYEVTVYVKDNGKGKLIATAEYPTGGVRFINTYTPGTADVVVINGQKNISGINSTNETFYFKLTQVDDENNVPENGFITTSSALGASAFSFDLNDLSVGTYYYKVEEVKGDATGWSYDSRAYIVKVEVKDDGEGKTTATVTYPSGDKVVFTNTYTNIPGPSSGPEPGPGYGPEPRHPYAPPAQPPISTVPIPTATPMPKTTQPPELTATPAPEIVINIEPSQPPIGVPEITDKSNPITGDNSSYTITFITAALAGIAFLTLMAVILMKGNRKDKMEETINPNE